MSEKIEEEIIIYQADDNSPQIDVHFNGETLWLSQKRMAGLFQTTPQNITIHIKNIYEEGELQENSTCKDFLQVQQEGSRQVERLQKFYSLDMIISVGYRVKSHIATQFRIWATARLKQAGGGGYWKELIERII